MKREIREKISTIELLIANDENVSKLQYRVALIMLIDLLKRVLTLTGVYDEDEKV